MRLHELDPIPRPDEVDPAEWKALAPGERVRALRWAEDEWPLPASVYDQLRRLPYWAFYGPEHGLPSDWFNAQGFLLPTFRPGGSRHTEFAAWRRQHRRRQWASVRLRARFRERWREIGPWVVLIAVAGFVIAGVLVQTSLERDFGDFAAGGWYLLLTFGVVVIVRILIAVARRYQRHVESWITDRVVLRRDRERTRRGGGARSDELG